MIELISDRVARYRTVDIGADSVDRWLYALLALGTIFGIGHHLDHIVRGNHVGWPLIPEVTAFTYSLGFYPFILIGLYLTLQERVGIGYWFLLFVAGSLMVTFVHFGPWASEPPQDIIQPYSNVYVGYFAVVWLFGFVGTFWAGTVYSAYRWMIIRY